MFARSFLGGHMWGYDQELAAVTVELLQVLIQTNALGFGAKKSRMPDVIPVPRPRLAQVGIRPQQPRRKATVRETVELLGPMLGGGR